MVTIHTPARNTRIEADAKINQPEKQIVQFGNQQLTLHQRITPLSPFGVLRIQSLESPTYGNRTLTLVDRYKEGVGYVKYDGRDSHFDSLRIRVDMVQIPVGCEFQREIGKPDILANILGLPPSFSDNELKEIHDQFNDYENTPSGNWTHIGEHWRIQGPKQRDVIDVDGNVVQPTIWEFDKDVFLDYTTEVSRPTGDLISNGKTRQALIDWIEQYVGPQIPDSNELNMYGRDWLIEYLVNRYTDEIGLTRLVIANRPSDVLELDFALRFC